MTLSHKIRHQGLSYHLHSLTHSFGLKRDKKKNLLSKLAFVNPTLLSPRFLKKVARWTKRLAAVKDEEKKILDEICALERKHKQHREKKMVRFARKAALPMPSPKDTKKKRKLWLMFFLLLLLEKRTPKKTGFFFNPRNG